MPSMEMCGLDSLHCNINRSQWLIEIQISLVVIKANIILIRSNTNHCMAAFSFTCLDLYKQIDNINKNRQLLYFDKVVSSNRYILSTNKDRSKHIKPPQLGFQLRSLLLTSSAKNYHKLIYNYIYTCYTHTHTHTIYIYIIYIPNL